MKLINEDVLFVGTIKTNLKMIREKIDQHLFIIFAILY
jgi:hypothetical protein